MLSMRLYTATLLLTAHVLSAADQDDKMVANNDLRSFATRNIRQLMNIGSQEPNVHVVVHLDIHNAQSTLVNELPLITTYDADSPATFPTTWKEKEWATIESNLLPGVVLEKPTLLATYIKDALQIDNYITKGDIMEGVEHICKHELELSPQTSHLLKQTFLNLIHGIDVNTRNQRLNYYEPTEIKNKFELANQLPTILKDIVLHSPCTAEVNKIITPLFIKTTGLDTQSLIPGALYAIGELIRNHNEFHISWYFQAISPQTTVHIAEQYCDLVQKDKPAYEYAYDFYREKSYFYLLIKKFPEALSAKPNDYITDDMRRLAFKAFCLKHPTWKNLLLSENHQMFEPDVTRHDLEEVYKRNNCMKVSEGALDALESQFIKAFAPVQDQDSQ